jgi:hypothetical protein
MKSPGIYAWLVFGAMTGGVLCAQESGPAAVAAETAAVPVVPANGATIVDCYDVAAANLEKVCEDYRRIKALELAKVRDIAFLDAYRNIQSVMPILKPINRELLRKRITNPDDIPAHKQEVERVESEVENMVELAARLLAEIEVAQIKEEHAEHTAVEMKPLTLQEIVQSPEFDPEAEVETQESQEMEVKTTEAMKELVKKAQENPEQRAVDVSPEMRAVQKEIKGAAQSPEQMSAQVFKLADMKYDVGRKVVSEGGAPVEWMFVDTWYVIGPFPNPQRINLNTKFPPETVINLSATYPGKNGKTVAWEFLQTNRAMCVPLNGEDYAIYYAYTELWFDEAVDLWITIGSDDKANVWINNLPVWISGDQLKVWRINEGMRKVHFKKGVNKVLYRVENGWNAVAFSLGIQVSRTGAAGR